MPGKKGSKKRDDVEEEAFEEEVSLKKSSKIKGNNTGDDDDIDKSQASNKKKGSKAVEEEPAAKPKGKKANHSDDEDEEDTRKSKKSSKAKGKRGDESDEDEEAEAPSKNKKAASKGKGKKHGDDSDEEEEVANSKASKAKPKGGKNEEDADESGDEAEHPNGNGAQAGLSKTALKKAKRDAKKNKGLPQEDPKNNKKKKGKKGHDSEEEEEENEDEHVDEEEVVPEPETAGEDYRAEQEIIEQMEALGIEDGEDSDARARRAEKKKMKKALEKKKKVKEAHGIYDSPPTMPTPPPQHVPGEDISRDDYQEEEENEDEREQVSEAEEQKKPGVAVEEDDEDEDEGKEKKGDAVVVTKKNKLSNKEKRRMKDELARREDELLAASMSKPPDNSVFAVSATSVDTESDSWKNSRDVIIPSFSITAKGKTLFKDAELRIAHGRRYGLIGPNGKGKSVLLRAIASRELPIPPSIDCLYVEQEVIAGDELAVNVVLSADTRRSYLLEREKALMEIVDDPTKELTDEIHEELKAVSDELRLSKADAAEAKALNLLHGLGFSEEMCRMPTKHLSGGWRMRVSIAKGLFLEPTLLLLDEPTNHLDLEAVIFLESVLSKWEKTLVVVSHDQDFLDEVCQEIIHLDSQRLDYYKGNYSTFEELFEVEMEKRKKDYEKQQKQLKESKKKKNQMTARERENELKRLEREKTKTDKARKNEELAIAAAGKNRGEKNAASAAAMDRPKDYVVKFSFPPPTELTPPIIQVRDVNFRYNDNAPWLFRGLNFGIDMSSRICICGPNGAGKSTLIGLLTEALSPTDGEVIVNRHLRVAAYKQHFVDALPLGKTPIEYLHAKHNVPEQDTRSILGRYGLPGEAHTIKMAALSGGQKARVVFADMSYQNPHIIIADEPSNNLDMQSIRALGDAINEFEGGVVLVSHDTRLITETNMILWVVERQTVLEQTGGIEEYREEILEKIAKREAEAARILEEKQAKRIAERENKLKEIEERRQKKKAMEAGGAQ